ncbi:MAG TPA: ATP-binding protein [Terriglobales bacterium]|nr:ATP-binding protein [Terriglobales bacterium]
MRPPFQLKTKLVLAISGMVLVLVCVLSYVYVSQLLRRSIREAYSDTDFVAHQIYQVARDAVEEDLNAPAQIIPPTSTQEKIEETLQTDTGVNSVLQSVMGYSRIIDYVAITDVSGRALLHSDPFMQDKTLDTRPSFDALVNASLWRQLRLVYGKTQAYEVDLPLSRAGVPFGYVRVGIQTVFLKNELRPQLNRTFTFTALAILLSLVIAAALSNLALKPLEDISARLDRMTAGEIELAPESALRQRTDEYGVVTTKIDKLGRQMRDVQEVFSALKENLDQIMANLQDGLMLFTRDSRVVLVSASAERFVGRPRSEILGRTVEEIFSGSSRLGSMILDAFRLAQAFDLEEVETASGRRVQVSLDFIRERQEQMGALLTIHDVESMHRIEDEIELSRRLAAIGRLTSGVAHEVKNPINAIVLHLEVLREKLPALEPASSRHLEVISNEIRRLDRVVQTLVDFTRPVELRLADTDLRRTLEDVILLAMPDAEQRGARIVRHIPDETLPVRIDIDLIKQALLNVVINGMQAMPQGGDLNIHARRDTDCVEVIVQDQGKGIPPEIQDRIFNLYFTTKKGGSGIGLAMAYRVMQLHNGSIEFKSQEGIGTSFHLRLPLTVSPEPMPQATAEHAQT